MKLLSWAVWKIFMLLRSNAATVMHRRYVERVARAGLKAIAVENGSQCLNLNMDSAATARMLNNDNSSPLAMV
jgi:hypothetical protein